MLIIVEHHCNILTNFIKLSGLSSVPPSVGGKRLCNCLRADVFFLKCMTSLSRSSFSSFPHQIYQTSRSHSGKLISTAGLWLISTFTTQTRSQFWVLEFPNVSLRCSDIECNVMFKSSAWLSSVEVGAYFVLIKQLCHMTFFFPAHNYCVKPALD